MGAILPAPISQPGAGLFSQ